MRIFSKLILVTVLAAVFCSCSSDDGDEPQGPKTISVKISYFYENTAEFFRYVNAEITYLDKHGREQQTVLNSSKTSFKYEETVDYASAPKDYACKFVLKKTGVEPETESCKFQGLGSYGVSVSAVKDNGESYMLGSSMYRPADAKENNIVKALQLIPAEGKVEYDYAYTLNK